jgi:hypothetical protein
MRLKFFVVWDGWGSVEKKSRVFHGGRDGRAGTVCGACVRVMEVTMSVVIA